jgi:cytochrome c oxidase assembly protein subunit 15
MAMALSRLVQITLVAVYVLILVGGIVRSTGAGMGCPDWPKCFGQWVPPTSAHQLPENYKDIYSAYRDKKNQRFAALLESMGMNKTAYQLRHDERIRMEADFNAVKTWTEYINRIVGMLTGILVVATFVSALAYRKTHAKVTLLAFLALVTVLVTGWFGSVVVSTNLTPWTVTLHMLLALVLVALLILIQKNLHPRQHAPAFTLASPWLAWACVLTIVQVILGTQVREAVDVVSATNTGREQWVNQLGLPFIIHRSFSWIVLAVNGYIVWRLFTDKVWSRAAVQLGVLALLPVITGVGLAWMGFPAFLQPLHLLLAALLFGTQFSLWLQVQPDFSPLTVKTT